MNPPNLPAQAMGASPPSEALLELRGLTKTFGPRWPFRGRQIRAVDAVSLSVRAGEVVALVGASGSGKSTLARLIVRLLAPSSGEIWWRGRNLLAEERGSPSLRFRHDVQMVFQDPYAALNPARRIHHQLARPLQLARKTAPEACAAAVKALLEEVGLPATFADRFPHELSGGQRQRVCIARALAVAPSMLVADEPTSMLDAAWRADILGLLVAQARERGRSVMLITHDLGAARAITDRLFVMSEGRVVESGAADVVVNAPAHPATRALLDALSFARSPGTK
ncbi:MAG TPA: dipeptide/oligopeptide/nickel ABC transporter ATP-binding protein [Polyangia bacterium]